MGCFRSKNRTSKPIIQRDMSDKILAFLRDFFIWNGSVVSAFPGVKKMIFKRQTEPVVRYLFLSKITLIMAG
jgi:hypothetical protein